MKVKLIDNKSSYCESCGYPGDIVDVQLNTTQDYYRIIQKYTGIKHCFVRFDDTELIEQENTLASGLNFAQIAMSN